MSFYSPSFKSRKLNFRAYETCLRCPDRPVRPNGTMHGDALFARSTISSLLPPSAGTMLSFDNTHFISIRSCHTPSIDWVFLNILFSLGFNVWFMGSPFLKLLIKVVSQTQALTSCNQTKFVQMLLGQFIPFSEKQLSQCVTWHVSLF